jgi:hypothetical protein
MIGITIGIAVPINDDDDDVDVDAVYCSRPLLSLALAP